MMRISAIDVGSNGMCMVIGEVDESRNVHVKKNITFTENLIPLGNPELLIGEINENYSVDSIAVVGHEPHLSTLVGILVAENARIDITLKKGGVCYLSADDLHHHDHRATPEWLLTPGLLTEIGEK